MRSRVQRIEHFLFSILGNFGNIYNKTTAASQKGAAVDVVI